MNVCNSVRCITFSLTKSTYNNATTASHSEMTAAGDCLWITEQMDACHRGAVWNWGCLLGIQDVYSGKLKFTEKCIFSRHHIFVHDHIVITMIHHEHDTQIPFLQQMHFSILRYSINSYKGHLYWLSGLSLKGSLFAYGTITLHHRLILMNIW